MKIKIGAIILLLTLVVESAHQNRDLDGITTEKLLNGEGENYLHKFCKKEDDFFRTHKIKIGFSNFEKPFKTAEGPVSWIRFLPPKNPLYVLNRQEKLRQYELLGRSRHTFRENLALEVSVRKYAESINLQERVLPLIDCSYNENYFYFLMPKYTPLSQALQYLSSLKAVEIARVFIAITTTYKLLNKHGIFHKYVNTNSIYYHVVTLDGLCQPVIGSFLQAHVGEDIFEQSAVIDLLLEVYEEIKRLKNLRTGSNAATEKKAFESLFTILEGCKNSHGPSNISYEKIEQRLAAFGEHAQA